MPSVMAFILAELSEIVRQNLEELKKFKLVTLMMIQRHYSNHDL